ncbi:unnamed protein product [Linum trigynum]
MTKLAIMASYPFCLYGYDIAVLRASGSIVADLGLSKNQMAVYAAGLSNGGYALGALVAGGAANWLCGRRYFLGCGGGLYVVGAVLVAFTDDWVASMCGRALSSFGVGMGLLVGPIFIAETAPSTTRGYHGAIPQVLMMAGAASAYVLESALLWAPSHIAWRVSLGITALPTALFVYYALFRLTAADDTPCWQFMFGKLASAERQMELCGATGTEPYTRREQLERVAGFPMFAIVNSSHVEAFPRRIPGCWAQLKERGRPHLRDMFATSALLVAQEATCEERRTLVHFVPTLLIRNGGLTSRLASSIAGLMLAVIKLLTTLASMEAASWSMAGRKELLLVSIGVAGCALGSLSGTTFADAHGRLDGGTTFALCCLELVVLEAGIAFGLGPIPWMYGPEVFPLAVRAPSLALCLTLKFAVAMLVDMTLPLLYPTSTEGVWVRFLVACGVTVVSFLVSCRVVRKTTCRVLMDEPE